MFRFRCFGERTVGNVQTFELGDEEDEIRVSLTHTHSRTPTPTLTVFPLILNYLSFSASRQD